MPVSLLVNLFISLLCTELNNRQLNKLQTDYKLSLKQSQLTLEISKKGKFYMYLITLQPLRVTSI